MKAMDHGAAALLHQRAGRSASTGLDTLPLHAQALVTGLLLGFLAILFFAITLAKIGASHNI